jgi:hypothetical protein
MARMSLQQFIDACPVGSQCVVTYRYERLPTAGRFLPGPADPVRLSYSAFVGDGSPQAWAWAADGTGASSVFGRLLALTAHYMSPGEDQPAA